MTICGFRVIDTMGGEIMGGTEIIPATKPLETNVQKKKVAAYARVSTEKKDPKVSLRVVNSIFIFIAAVV